MYNRKASSPGMRVSNSNSNCQPFQPLDNLSKKRPSSTKLDIEKMYEESLELAAQHKRLLKENKQLKEEYGKVEAVKLSRQNLISTVQKIVAEKSKEVRHKNKQKQKFSWLVHNLGNKIADLKCKVEQKQNAIQEILDSKQSRTIKQKEEQIHRLNTAIQEARSTGSYRQGVVKDPSELSEIKEIVWMEQELRQKEAEIAQAEQGYKEEEENVRSLMQKLAVKKTELRSIKDMETEYIRVQELFKEEKKKKEQRIAGNKTYLEELQHEKAQEVAKLEQLKTKFTLIESEEKQNIQNLKQQLQGLKIEYQERVKVKKETCIKLSEKRIPQNTKKEVKRVTFDQVKPIAGNLNYTLALKGVSQAQMCAYFTEENKEEYSIQEVADILKSQPFSLEDPKECLLVARYVVEDAGDGYFLEDMDSSQSACIIKCILSKLVGEIRIFGKEQAEEMRSRVGPILFKFGKLVQQSLDVKEGLGLRETGKMTVVSREAMIDALENSLSSIQSETFLHEEIDFTIFYLFSWSRNLEQLEVRRIFSMLQEEVNWPTY